MICRKGWLVWSAFSVWVHLNSLVNRWYLHLDWIKQAALRKAEEEWFLLSTHISAKNLLYGRSRDRWRYIGCRHCIHHLGFPVEKSGPARSKALILRERPSFVPWIHHCSLAESHPAEPANLLSQSKCHLLDKRWKGWKGKQLGLEFLLLVWILAGWSNAAEAVHFSCLR